MLYDFHPEFTSMVDQVSVNDATATPWIVHSMPTANTYPSYSQIIASTPYDSYGLVIRPLSQELSARQLYKTMGQIAIGAAGSESNIIEGISFGQVRTDATRSGSRSMFFPLFIPSGSRLSYRCKCNLAVTAEAYMSIYLFRQNSYPFNQWTGTRVTTYGIDDANLKASVEIAPGVGVDTWSAWTTVTASTTRRHKALLFSIWATQAQVTEYAGYNVQFAVGAVGAESIISPVIRMNNPPEHLYQPYFRPTEHVESFVDLPAGSRVSARVMVSNSAEQRLIGASFYGIS